MNKAELIQTLENTLPELKGKLTIERVLFRAADNKAYFSLLSEELVDERAFLKLDQRLSGLFPGMRIALRVASPHLADDFQANITTYTPVLKAFLRRQSPAIKTWLDDVGWSIADGQILLICPDDFAIHFFKRNQLDDKLSQAVWDIFRLKLPVQLEKCGEREQWGGAHAAPTPRPASRSRRRRTARATRTPPPSRRGRRITRPRRLKSTPPKPKAKPRPAQNAQKRGAQRPRYRRKNPCRFWS